MHCRECGTESLGLDPTTCSACGARLVPFPILTGDDFGPGTAEGGMLRALILIAGAGAALVAGAAVVSAAV